MKFSILLILLISITSCKSQNSQEVIKFDKIIVNPEDPHMGYYWAARPASNKIEGVLVLFPGLGQRSEAIQSDTKLPEVAVERNLLWKLTIPQKMKL